MWVCLREPPIAEITFSHGPDTCKRSQKIECQKDNKCDNKHIQIMDWNSVRQNMHIHWVLMGLLGRQCLVDSLINVHLVAADRQRVWHVWRVTRVRRLPAAGTEATVRREDDTVPRHRQCDDTDTDGAPLQPASSWGPMRRVHRNQHWKGPNLFQFFSFRTSFVDVFSLTSCTIWYDISDLYHYIRGTVQYVSI